MTLNKFQDSRAFHDQVDGGKVAARNIYRLLLKATQAARESANAHSRRATVRHVATVSAAEGSVETPEVPPLTEQELYAVDNTLLLPYQSATRARERARGGRGSRGGRGRHVFRRK